MKEGLVALLDCNNFFVSCERVFRPDLWQKPVIVLSSNDGCVVARSNEAKALGIPMGIPFFRIKELVERERVRFFSGNFPLYEDISRRVMKIAAEFSDKSERYSIDESFLFLYGKQDEVVERARLIKKYVEQGTGVPVSIGIANTKTLAKLASKRAKRDPATDGVFYLSENERAEILEDTQVGEVWGIGSKTSQKLVRFGLPTALALTNSSDQWIRKNLGLSTLRTTFELRGIRAETKEATKQGSKSIISSRSFGKKTSKLSDLEESIAEHITNAAAKMRREKKCTSYVSVSIRSARLGSIGGQSASAYRQLFFPTDDTLEMIKQAHEALREIFKEGTSYSKAGILLSDFSPKNLSPTTSLFEEVNPLRSELMETLDAIEKKHGKNTIFPAAVGTKRDWAVRQEFRSPRYTTDWNDLPRAKA